MLQNVNRDGFLVDMFREPLEMFGREFSLPGLQLERIRMKTDLIEKDDAYEMKIDLPGFTKEQIHLEMENGVLVVKAERSEESEDKDKAGNVVHRERHSGSMERHFVLGDAVKEDEITAEFEDGVLKVSLPKAKPVEPERKQIEIR